MLSETSEYFLQKHVTNEEVRRIRTHESEYLIVMMKKRKLGGICMVTSQDPFAFGKDNLAGESESNKNVTKTEEEMGRQRQRMDKNWVWRLQTGKYGKILLLRRLWCPDDRQGKGT